MYLKEQIIDYDKYYIVDVDLYEGKPNNYKMIRATDDYEKAKILFYKKCIELEKDFTLRIHNIIYERITMFTNEIHSRVGFTGNVIFIYNLKDDTIMVNDDLLCKSDKYVIDIIYNDIRNKNKAMNKER